MIRYTFIFLITSLILIFGKEAEAQEPQFSQYFAAPLYYNPANVGLNEGLKIRIDYRNQWPEYSDDLKTYNFSMDVAERYMPGAGGLGIIFNTNKEGSGFIRRNMIGAMGSARIRMNKYWLSQVGFMAAYVQKQIDTDDFIWSDQLDDRHGVYFTPNQLLQDLKVKMFLILTLAFGGILNYQKELMTATFGIAVHHITKPNESFSSLDIRVPRKYVFHADFVLLQRSNPKRDSGLIPVYCLLIKTGLTLLRWVRMFLNQFYMPGCGTETGSQKFTIIRHLSCSLV
ncbi:MAG: PorP/SprF family type IX secretion system membrane protein [Bacteroidales bacterium]